MLDHLATYALAYILLLGFVSIAYSWFDSHRNNELWYQNDK